MKTFLQLFIAVSISIISQAQTLPGINYQALLRNAEGQPLASQTIIVQVSILHGSETGTPIYTETHNATTNAFGQINLSIGEGEATLGVFDAINWGNGPYLLKTGVDLNQSGSFQELEVVKFYSVPYSYHSNTANVANVAGSIPVLSSAERDAIENPVAGMQIFNNNRFCIEYFDGLNWASSIPAGTIQPFGGSIDKVPQGWLLCNGAEYFKTEKQDLFNSIGYNWGASSNPDKFKIPDLRGVFLRGVNNGRTDTYKDPDVNSRSANGLGNKDDAGSLQMDAFQGHIHTSMTAMYGTLTGTANWVIVTSMAGNLPLSDGTNGTPRISSESRAKNAYVNYIIKY